MFFKFLPVALISGIFLLTQPVTAQESNPGANQLGISFSPQHLLVNGLALDLEGKTNSASIHSYSVSPRFYFGATKTVDYFSGRKDSQVPISMVGAGVEVLHRINFRPSGQRSKPLYFAYGLNYHHFVLEYQANGWLPELGPDNVEYLVYKSGTFKDLIDRVGAVTMVGSKSNFSKDRFFTDIYSGIGYRRSFVDSDYPVLRFSNSILDFGDSGIYITAGLKIGMWL